ncbi:MAG TPA: class I SAM-dependent methyltransferase [Terriglobia bacterium]|jgi:ubiquinone/menaquinone biosynthesis C-methylase UbiE|nr:class I SAM-dependent methyltransferase [Terriglobia bacterium]
MPLEAPADKPVEKRAVTEYFDAESSYWDGLYNGNDVFAVIHQQRRLMALKYFDELALPQRDRILEVGCGAGLLTVDLARRGYKVEALDRVKSMVDLTKRNARNFGVHERINAHIADVCRLPFQNGTFRCLIALGVVPWVTAINDALKEISRVVAPGGYVIINADNRYRLNHILDLARMPALAGLKGKLKKALEKYGLRKPSKEPDVYRHSYTEFRELLASVGLMVIKHHTIGFGPFSFFRYEPFSDSFAVSLHNRLQHLADQGVFLLRSTGTQILVTAVKS